VEVAFGLAFSAKGNVRFHPAYLGRVLAEVGTPAGTRR
jgi:hypothetical protein